MGIKPLCLVLLAVCVGSLWGTAAAEEGKKASDTSGQMEEGRIWFPRVAFKPPEPGVKGEDIRFWDREVSIEYLKYTLFLSRKNGLELTGKDSDFYLRVGGRIYLDFVHYFEDKNDLGPDGVGLRTLQIDGSGRFSEKWLYRLSVGGLANGGKFDGSGAYLDDAFVTYVGQKNAWLFGQQDEPFSLEQLTSSLATTFMERGLPNALAPGKTLGVSFRTTRNRWSMSAGLFGNDLASAKDGGSQGYGFTGRFVFRPEMAENRLLHLGGSISYRGVPASEDVYFRYRPESGLTNVRYVNTGTIDDADRIKRLGLEAAWVSGPLSLQAEYMIVSVDRSAGNDDSLFHGWYAYVSWFPAGGSRKYFDDEAIFGYPEIQSKWGALELAARYSTLNLTGGSILGGQERNVTFGINWYFSRKLRLMAEYLLVFCDENANDDGTVIGGDRPQIFQMRLQMRF